jgi:hypothetical protein
MPDAVDLDLALNLLRGFMAVASSVQRPCFTELDLRSSNNRGATAQNAVAMLKCAARMTNMLTVWLEPGQEAMWRCLASTADILGILLVTTMGFNAPKLAWANVRETHVAIVGALLAVHIGSSQVCNTEQFCQMPHCPHDDTVDTCAIRQSYATMLELLSLLPKDCWDVCGARNVRVCRAVLMCLMKAKPTLLPGRDVMAPQAITTGILWCWTVKVLHSTAASAVTTPVQKGLAICFALKVRRASCVVCPCLPCASTCSCSSACMGLLNSHGRR